MSNQKRTTGSGRATLRARHAAALAALALSVAAALVVASSAHAAGRSATGEPAFHPCSQCHPVTIGSDGKPTKPLPIGLDKHEVELEVHDTLGRGDSEAACIVCHDEPTRDPGKLLAADGTRVDVTGDVSRVCQRCHFEKYREWQAGLHGKGAPKCSAAGCHDPHTPSWIYVAALPPFQGTGIEVKAVGVREPFTPLAGPPVQPPVHTPLWLSVLATIGTLIVVSTAVFLVTGGSRR